ncbi:cysteine protease [Cryptosporidium canis]|uniref:Cysteine protease n=1 Tax=Cryptosporidium canis TaxID=195482 RepID=A0ABQ8P3S2_9CRYT|nr:cysteine protease [Cryptosporidium canis]KAJ1609113.1 cysteine protease [Cryptosporidium canis]
MNIVEELENLDIYILESLFNRLNKLEITQDEIGEPVNAKYFAIGYFKKNKSTNKSTIIISDAVKLNFIYWDKSISEFIEDIVITLPKGFTILGLIQSKSDCSEWLKTINIDLKKHTNKYGKLWDPEESPNLLIVPNFDILSIISSLKIFLIHQNANYLIPDSRIQTIKSLTDLGIFYCSQVHISLPLLSTNSHDSNQLDSNISHIEDIIESNLVMQNSYFNNNSCAQTQIVYNFNTSFKTNTNIDQNSLPIQIPVFFSQSLQSKETNSNQTSNPHFFTSYTIINNDEKCFQKINLHLQACLFKLQNDNDELKSFQNTIKKCFILQCNYIKERIHNPTSLFFYSKPCSSFSTSNNHEFEFYIFKIPQISVPITLLNTGILYENSPAQKNLRRLWSNIFNINPLMPLITKNLALIPVPKSKSNELKHYHDKMVSPHLIPIKQVKSNHSNDKYRLSSYTSNHYCDFYLQMDSKIMNSKLPIIYQCFGDFYFFHYNHDNFKDSGWGCTYRSLQMVLSWYLLNNYTNKHILSITEMQDFLKKNDPTHCHLEIGSKKWIGTVEASFILMGYLGISCKLKYFYDVEEFLRDYDIISDHFQKVSTPIILSVGDYSYLLVAIQISKDPLYPLNPNVQYLLVDPHYSNKDEPELIFKKNGVSWKNPEFFKSISKNKYVNMLLPLNISEKDSQIIY